MKKIDNCINNNKPIHLNIPMEEPLYDFVSSPSIKINVRKKLLEPLVSENKIAEVYKEIEKEKRILILVGVAVIVMAAGIAILGAAIGDKGMKFVGTMLAIIGGLGVAMGVAGLAAPFIALGAGALILAGAALISIGLGLIAFDKVSFGNSGALGFSNGQKTKEFSMFGVKFGGRPKTNLEVALEAVEDGYGETRISREKARKIITDQSQEKKVVLS